MDGMMPSEAPAGGSRITFWYGCNVLRHGDIIHACIDILKALGYEPLPVGGPDYCCGTVKDGNQLAADGMARRTVDKLNAKDADRVVAWCPSCHSHMKDFMAKSYETGYGLQYLVQLLHENRERLKPLLIHRVPLRVLVHRHVGFNDKVAVNAMVPELLSLIPGLQVVEDDYRGPGYMCALVAAVPRAMVAMVRETEAALRRQQAEALVTIFHQCQRELCGLEVQGVTQVFNYVQLIARSMGLAYQDEYKAWKKAADGAAAAIGSERIEKIGIQFFDRAVLPEILKKTSR
jgi:hypothetical protein